MKKRLLSPTTFVRLPLVAWAAPKAIRSDMSGASLLGLFAALETSGTPAAARPAPIRRRDAARRWRGPVVSDAEKQREVSRFLNG